MLITVCCAHEGCGDYREINTGDLSLLVSPGELKKEVVFVCYRHWENMLAKGIISDHLALILVRVAKRPGLAASRLDNNSHDARVKFLLRHGLMVAQVETLGDSKVSTKKAHYITEAGRALIMPFLNKERTITFSPYWGYSSDAISPWWDELDRSGSK